MSGNGNPRQAAEARLARYLADAATADDLARLPGDVSDPDLGQQAGMLVAIDRLLPLALGSDGAAFAAEVSERLAATPASRKRFTRGVLRSVRRRQRTTGWIWPTIAAAAALLLGWWLIPFGATSTALPSTGVRDEAGMALQSGAMIDATRARALVCSDGTRLELTAGTRIAIESGSDLGGWRFRLERGEVAASVAPQAPDQGLRIATPHADATVIGTRFRLAVIGDRSRLEVSEGRVALQSPLGSSRVGPGEMATASATSAPTLERWHFDFAEGISERADAKWWLGTLATGADGRRALASKLVADATGAWHGCRVTLRGDNVSAPSWRLRIRAELAATDGELVVQPHNLTQGQNYEIQVPARAGILDLELALDQGRALSDRDRAWTTGDVLDEVLIYQSGTGEGGLILHGFSVSIRPPR